MFKQIFFACAFLVVSSAVFAENGDNSNAFNKYMSPEGGVNPMSGTVALSKSLASISAGEVSVGFELSYSGNVFKEVETRNDETTMGLVGLGWTLGRAKIVSDNRGTSFIGDDQYYLVLSSGGRFKIFKQNPSDSNDEKWWVEGNPYMKVEQVVGSADVTGKGDYVSFVKGWKLTDTRGVVHIYGDVDDADNKVFLTPTRNATEFDLFWPLKNDKSFGYGLVGVNTAGSAFLYPCVWNVSKETDVEGNFLQYTYEQINEGLSGNFNVMGPWNSGTMGYTKEAYLKNVISSKGDALEFEYENKGEGDFLGEYLDNEGKEHELLGSQTADMSIEKMNRKYLSKIVIKKNNEKIGSVELCYSAFSPIDVEKSDGLTNYIKYLNNRVRVKRLLTAVRFFNKKGDETDYEYYKYYDGTEKATVTAEGAVYPLGALYSVKGKECGWVEYTYMKESLGQGHKETLPVTKLFGKGYLEDGTPYLVGHLNKTEVIVFHRINGSWKEVQRISTKKVDDVELGDQGWFLVKDELSDTKIGAYVYQWDGKMWKNVYGDSVNNPEHSFFENPFGDSHAMNVFAGPDYVVMACISGNYTDSKAEVHVVWSKWGKSFEVGSGFNDVQVNQNGIRIIPQKNHMLIQVYRKKFGNSVKFFVYTFDSKGGVQETFSDTNLDNGNMYYLDDNYFIEVGEPSAYFGGDSRFRAWVWNGTNWSREYKEVFANDGLYTEMDLQAHGKDYYTVRHHAKRYMTNFFWDGEQWSIPNNQKRVQLQDYAWFSKAWKWAGFSGSDFFVAGQSRLKCKWSGCDVKKYVYLHLYYQQGLLQNSWKYDYIGSKGDKMNEKNVITGKDWFVEKNVVRTAWIWNGSQWNEENLNSLGNSLKDAYSLGENAFAISKGNSTDIYYKVGNTFLGSFGAYCVKTKSIFEPVVDKSVTYTYAFSKRDGAIAYDEANNTPLFKEMSVTLPAGQGTMHSVLCNGEYNGEFNVGIGSSCVQTQFGRSNSKGVGDIALSTRKETFYERYRDNSWPNSVYQDRVAKEVSFNGLTKDVSTYGYSTKNGLLVSTKKRNGTKSTEEVVKYVSDLSNPLSDYDMKLGKSNRIETVAGGYSCIGDCSTGRVVSAFANGWTDVGGLYRSVSTWSMSPKKRMTKADVESDISHIVKNGTSASYANWKRSSYNSVYQNGEVIETVEGPKKVKVSSFKNPLTHRVYGTAVGCGVDEGLLLSGEYCGNVNNVAWTGCVLSGQYDGIAGYAVDGKTGSKYGRFSTKMLKLSSSDRLSATIVKPQMKKYKMSAWVQTVDNSSVKLIMSLGTFTLDEDVQTNGEWKRIELLTPEMPSSSPATFSVSTNAPSGIRLQDIRVLPYEATSSVSFWNDEWDKVMTIVDDRGVGSYTVYDEKGRDTKHYSETESGFVYLSSNKTFDDGSCVVGSSGVNMLRAVKVNGQMYDNPSFDKGFVLGNIDVDVEMIPFDDGAEIKYALVKGNASAWKGKPLNWEPVCCGGLNPLQFNFSDSPEWTLFVDVAPFDPNKLSGDYAFGFSMKKKDWVVYGQLNGFSDGASPLFRNTLDSAGIMFLDRSSKSIFVAELSSTGSWGYSSTPIVNNRIDFYGLASGQINGEKAYFVNFIPHVSNADESKINLAYVKNYSSLNGSGYVYNNLNDETFSADYVKMVVNNNNASLLYRVDSRIINTAKTFRDTVDTNKTYQKSVSGVVSDGMLYSKSLVDARGNQWKNIGSTPVFDKDTLSVSISGKDTVLKIVHGNLVSYFDGVVCDYNNRNADMVAGPGGNLYVAYVGNVKNFEVAASATDDDGSTLSGKAGPALIVVKRLYSASETSLGRSVWAGPSRISGLPRYEGDIVSWDGSNLHAIEDAQSVKLAYGGKDLYMAVVYRTHLDDVDGDIDESVNEGELALTVFKGSVEYNVNADGVVYSEYLRWNPLIDNSVMVAKNGNSLVDERKRVVYLDPDDIYDFEVRTINGQDYPYLMFRNKDNEGHISVVKYNGYRWLSVGNPAFAYPLQSNGSANLAVASNGSPYVVYKQGMERGYASRIDRLVSMRYCPTNALDLTISSLDFGSASLNAASSFRQYILNYSISVGIDSSISLLPILKTPSHVSRVDFYVNNNYFLSMLSNATSPISIPLVDGLNRIELRVVGIDGTELSYYANVGRKPLPSPNIWGTANSLVLEGSFVGDSGKTVLDITPIVVPGFGDPTKKDNGPNGSDTLKFNVHLDDGWNIVLLDSINGDSVFFSGDTIPLMDTTQKYIAVSSDSDTVTIHFTIRPDTASFILSSNSTKPSTSSSNDNPDDCLFYGSCMLSSSQSDISSGTSSSCYSCNVSFGMESLSSGIGSISSGSINSSSGNGGNSSGIFSSSSGLGFSSSSGVKVSDNVPEEVRAVVDAKYYASGSMRIGNQVSVNGRLFAGNRIEIGVESGVLDEIVSGGDVSLSNRAKVDRIRLAGNLQVQDGAVHGVVVRDNGISSVTLPQIPFRTGSSDITIERERSSNVTPGLYRNLAAREKSTIRFAAGDYYFDSFWVDPYAVLEFAAGTRIWIANGFNISNFCRVTHAGNVGDLFIYIGSNGYISIGNNVEMRAVVYAPRASVQIFDHTVFDGLVWSVNFNVEPFSILK